MKENAKQYSFNENKLYKIVNFSILILGILGIFVLGILLLFNLNIKIENNILILIIFICGFFIGKGQSFFK